MIKKLSMSSVAIVLTLAMVACTVDQVLVDLKLLTSVAGAIIPALGQLSSADAAAAQKISKIASDGIALVQQDYDAFKSSGASSDLQKVQFVVNSLRDNLDQELALIKVSNPALVTKVTAWVALITTTLNAILSVLPQTKVSGKMTLAGPPPTKAEIKARWDSEVCGGDASCAALVK